MPEPLSIVPGKSDKEVADDLRNKFEEAMKTVLSIMDEANEAGLSMTFNVGIDYKGKNILSNLTVFKKL